MNPKRGRPRRGDHRTRILTPPPESLNAFQAATYLRAGAIPEADGLKKQFEASGGSREPCDIWGRLEADAQSLLDHARAGRIRMFGEVSGGWSVVAPSDLHGDLWLEVLTSQVVVDLNRNFTDDFLKVRDVRFARSDLVTLRHGHVQDLARKVHEETEVILREGRVDPGRGCLARVVELLAEKPVFWNAERNTLERYARPAVKAWKDGLKTADGN